MKRRTFLATALAATNASPLFAALRGERWGEAIEVRHLLTHVSGLTDQLASNNALRKRQAPLAEFVEETIRTPLDFSPSTRYQYSSMGILLAARIGELLSGMDILTVVERNVFEPLGMKHSAQGLERFQLEDMVPCQMGQHPNRGAAIRRPKTGIGTVPTGASWECLGEARTLPRRMWAGFSASFFALKVRLFAPRRHG